MYTILTGAGLGILLILLFLSSIAGLKASRLMFTSDVIRLRSKIRKLMNWSISITILALLFLISVIMISLSYDMAFWVDLLFYQAPLVIGPVLILWVVSIPRLRKLYRETNSGSTASVNFNLQSEAAHPKLVGPFQMTTFGTFTAFYFALVVPGYYHWLDIAIPVCLFLLITSVLWLLRDHSSNNILITRTFVLSQGWKKRWVRWSCTFLILGIAITPFFLMAMKDSLLPDRIDMSQGIVDYGGGIVTADHHGMEQHDSIHSDSISVTDLAGPQQGVPDQQFTLTAEKSTIHFSSGKSFDAWTFNGTGPGPELRMKEGDLIEVTLINKNIDAGVTIHWHGLDVPNNEDGVAGVTQNAVLPGHKHVYRFIPDQVGTFWYHTHQHSKVGVEKGLFGSLIIEPRNSDSLEEQDITVLTHSWDEVGLAIGSYDTIQNHSIEPGTPVRLRLINTDNWTLQKFTLTGTEFRVTAIDGVDLNQPGMLKNVQLQLTTGGRYDIAFTMPNRPVFLNVGGGNGQFGLFMSPDGKGEIPRFTHTSNFEPQNYGEPTPLPFDLNSDFDREFMMILDNKLSFYNGVFGFYDLINGAVFPNTPMFMVQEGDLVKTTFINRSSVEHPMHLHGHKILVLSRNGEKISGSPWWSDTLSVLPGESYEVAFRADNPGLWMDHCHNLVHAAAGMTMHLMYEGITTPFTVGSESANYPE